MFNGRLESDSPALFRQIRNIFNNSAIKEIQKIYLIAYSNNSYYEKYVNRDPLVNYNPRPARYLQILMNDCSIQDLSILKICLFYCTEKLPDILPSEISPLEQESILSLRDNKTSFPIDNTAIIRFVELLDIIRHVPLMNSKKVNQEVFISSYTNLLKKYPNIIDNFPKLEKKIQTAFRLYFSVNYAELSKAI